MFLWASYLNKLMFNASKIVLGITVYFASKHFLYIALVMGDLIFLAWTALSPNTLIKEILNYIFSFSKV